MTLTRRALFKGMGASLLMAPSIVRASSLDYVPREANRLHGADLAAAINAELRRVFFEHSFVELPGFGALPRVFYVPKTTPRLDTAFALCLTACEI